jgi:hypothetical protein
MKRTDKKRGDSGERRDRDKGKKGTEKEEDGNYFKVESGEQMMILWVHKREGKESRRKKGWR